MVYRIAAASSDGRTVDQHFGRAGEFTILETDPVAGTVRATGTRRVPLPCRGGGRHDEAALRAAAEALSDCGYLLASRVGPGAAAALEAAGIAPYELPGEIADAVERLLRHIEIQNMLRENF